MLPAQGPLQRSQADREVRAPRQHDEVERATERGLPKAGCARAARPLRSHLPRSAKGAVSQKKAAPARGVGAASNLPIADVGYIRSGINRPSAPDARRISRQAYSP